MASRETEFHKRVKWALRVAKVKSLPWVPLIGHTAAVVTIGVAYFGRSGRLLFDFHDWLDWTVLGAICTAFLIGLMYTIRETRRTPKELTRSQLTDFINHSRYNADRRLTVVAGDLTWLPEDLDDLEDLLRRRRLDVRIYYQPKAVSDEVAHCVRKLAGAGVDFRPYPEGIDVPFKCTLVDSDNPDETRLYVYRRIGKKVTGTARGEQKFEWLEFEGAHNRMIRAIQSFLWAIDRRAVATITIGISGANNVGKTTLARALQAQLEPAFGVTYYPDVFRDATITNGLEANYLMLISQLWREAMPDGDVAIFDRTAVDNFCYLNIKNADGASPARADAIPIVLSAAKRLDIIVLVRRETEEWTAKTRHVRPRQRRRAADWLERFYREHGVTVKAVSIDGRDIEGSAVGVAREIADTVQSIAEQRRLRKRGTGL